MGYVPKELRDPEQERRHGKMMKLNRDIFDIRRKQQMLRRDIEVAKVNLKRMQLREASLMREHAELNRASEAAYMAPYNALLRAEDLQ